MCSKLINQKLRVALLGFSASLLTVELLLRIFHVAETNYKKAGIASNSIYDKLIDNHYRIQHRNESYQNRNRDFTYTYQINALGYVALYRYL